MSTKSFMQRGADLTYVSCFPAEAEVLYPPLTFLRPIGEPIEVTTAGLTFTVINVRPDVGS